MISRPCAATFPVRAVGTQDDLATVRRNGRPLNQLAAQHHCAFVVAVRLVGFEDRELGIVLEICALVAEHPADLEHLLHTAHAQALEIQLRGDPQIQIQVVGVDMSDERCRVRAAVHLLQDRSLDLHVAALSQRITQGFHNIGPCDE